MGIEYKQDTEESFGEVMTEWLMEIVLSSPTFVDFVFDNIVRGKELSLLYRVLIKKKPDIGQLYSFKALPENIVPTDIVRIKKVVCSLSLSIVK